jgi:chemotaxis response regulator CheB
VYEWHGRVALVNNVQRIILVHNSRLLLGILRRVIEKADHLEVVGEMASLQYLNEKMGEANPDWVILNDEQGERNLEIINELMKTHPSVRFLTVNTEGSPVRMRWLEPHEKNLSGLSLADILKLLT